MTTLPSFLQEALHYSIEQTRKNAGQLTSFPELTYPDGTWFTVDDGGWVGAHWTGLLWLAYVHTQDLEIEQCARAWTERLAPRAFDTTTHDLGFLFELSHLLGYKFTGDAKFKAPVIQASKTLIRRFNTKGGFFQAWGALDGPAELRGKAIIDTMMNLEMLYWASKETGDATFAKMATTHANMALERHVRPDWSTSHTTEFNPETGEFLRQDTAQGLSANSCWSRGQSWAVYGYAETFRETGDPRYLDAARNLAEYILAHLPEDLVPYWDYNSPLIPDDVRDSAAASIFASGLLILASVETDTEKAKVWREKSIQILESLWNNYSSRQRPEQSILIHGTRSKPHNYMDHGLIYGDYYFVEAITRLLKPELDL